MPFNLETASTDEVLAHAYATRLNDPLVAELCKRLEIANETLDALGEQPSSETLDALGEQPSSETPAGQQSLPV